MAQWLLGVAETLNDDDVNNETVPVHYNITFAFYLQSDTQTRLSQSKSGKTLIFQDGGLQTMASSEYQKHQRDDSSILLKPSPVLQ
jgi:hypothetical protein